MAVSKDGTMYLNDTDMKTIIEAAREEDEGKTTVKNRPQAGAKLDLKIWGSGLIDEGGRDMNISSNNMKWFSGYSLMNRLFSQKNGNQAGVSNQAAHGITS